MSKKYLSDYLTDYLTRYLPLQIGASPNTIRSYRDAFIVFLRYCRDELKIKPEKSQPYGLTTGSAGGLDEPLRGIFRYRL